MSQTTERTREDAVVELAIANAASKVLRDVRYGVPRADEVHKQINLLLDELVGR